MTLLFFMLAVVISCIIFKFVFLTNGNNESAGTKEADRANALISATTSNKATTGNNAKAVGSNLETTHAPEAESIYFDPNTADAETLLKVGFTPWQVKNIMKYRAKGGTFHRKEDVKRIYDLTYGQWDHIEPLIRIGRKNQYIADNEDVSYKHTSSFRTSKGINSNGNVLLPNEQSEATDSTVTPRIVKLHQGEKIDINLNDTLQMQRIPGIASIRARKLSAYIKRLGGLASIDQLSDDVLRDMPLNLEDYIIIDQSKIHKLRINQLNAKQLANHPYISWSQARQIAERIRLYGPIKNWSELLFLSEMTETDKVRLEPYISFE